jgi:hypothetical protein
MMLVVLWLALSDAYHESKTSKVEKTKASESSYNDDLLKAAHPGGDRLSNADLAFHALNTYGWDCDEVVQRGKLLHDQYFIITCASGLQLRVYPRHDQHPSIRNIEGGWETLPDFPTENPPQS